MNESTLVPREEMSDLEWLARNVHEWKGCDWSVLTRNHDYCLWLTKESCKDAFLTKNQWLARRAELQNKPSWDDFRESAKFMAQDSDGAWRAFESEPTAQSLIWNAKRGWRGYAYEYTPDNRGKVLGDWRDTLEKRPEQDVFEPFVSVEDAKLTIMQSDGDVKHFGGIIGRSLPLEEDAATAKQQAPKGSGNPILGMVLADLTNRALEGKEKYGEPLLAHNGRNALWDLYQELLDAAMYIRQAIEEQKQ